MMIRKILLHVFFSIIVVLCCSGSILAKKNSITVGISTGYPPYYYQSDEQLKGVCIEVIESVCLSMGVEISYIEYPWKRLLLSAQKGEVDAIMPLFKTAERQKYLNFDNLILAYEEVNFFVKKDSPLRNIKNHEELFKHAIGVVTGYSYGKYFDTYQGLNTVVTQNDQHLLRMFANNRFPVGIGNRFVVVHNANMLGLTDDIAFLSPPLSREPLYMGFTKKGKKEHLVDTFSQKLLDLRKSEKYQKILEKYGLQ